MIEAIEAKMEEEPNLTPAEVARRAMSAITAPIITITLVLMSVFVPVAFIPQISGELFKLFAVVVTVSTIISAINALTLSAARCGVLLKHSHGSKRFPMRQVRSGINFARDGYATLVKRLMRMAVIGLLALAVIFPVTGWCSRRRRPASSPQKTREPSSARSCCPRDHP